MKGMFAAIALWWSMAPVLASPMPGALTDAMRSATEITFYSIEPWPDLVARLAEQQGDAEHATWIRQRPELYGNAILGQVTLSGAEMQAVVQAFEHLAVPQSEGMNMCFDPRHAIRVEQGADVFDLLLCVACDRIEVRRNGHGFLDLGARGSVASLDHLLQAHGLRLSTSGE